MYKDKDKQREANRQANKRYRDKGITEKVSRKQGITGSKEHSMECDPDTLAVFNESKSIKRGKDIKCFEDLPVDVQQSINKMSEVDVDGTIDKAEKAKRTLAAIKYQHLFPDSQGLGMCPVCTGKEQE